MLDSPSALFDTVAFHITDRCNIRCAHCMPESAPECVSRMGEAELCGWIAALAALGRTRKICLTGGEPFVERKLLLAASDAAAANGLECAVMTNASWGTSGEAAVRVLQRYPGITKIGISTDRFHREFVSPEYVRHVVHACVELGKTVLVRVSYLQDAAGELTETRASLGASLRHLDTVEAQPVMALGRARKLIPLTQLFEMPEDALAEPCRVADTPVVAPDGSVFACCGPSMQMSRDSPLYLGDLRTTRLADIQADAEANTALNFIRAIGPKALLRKIAAEGVHVEVGQQARHICELCTTAFASAAARQAVRELVARDSVQNEVARARLIELGEVPRDEDLGAAVT
ncbi:MAG: radical SAM protein [Pseudomonadota bacterium]